MSKELTFAEYAEWCLTKWGLPLARPLEQHLGNVALGLAGEWVEVEEASLAFGSLPRKLAELDGALKRRGKVVLELGDVLFYLTIAQVKFDEFYKRSWDAARERYFEPSTVVCEYSVTERDLRHAVGRVCDGVKKALYHDRPLKTDEKLRYKVEADLQRALDELHVFAGYVTPGGLLTIAQGNQKKLDARYKGAMTAAESVAKADEKA